MAVKRPPTLGCVTDQMYDIREQRRALEAQDKELKAKYDKLEKQLIELLDQQGVDRCSGAHVSASITVSQQFSFDGDTGFDKFMPWMAKNKYYHLVQRRLSAPAMREIAATKGKIPGVVAYEERKISLRNL